METEIKSARQYKRERAICDAAAAYSESLMCDSSGKRVRNYITAEEAAAPVYAKCSNEMRGRVDQWETLHNPPERFVAYIGSDGRSVTVWTGLALGAAWIVSSWPTPRSWQGSRRYAYGARIAGREYAGRGFGAGMAICLKETAASRRSRESGK